MNVNDALFSLMHSFRNNMMHEIKMLDLDLSPMHLKSLKIISTIEGCTGQKLAAFMGRDKAQINRLIKDLVNQEFVIKTCDTKDKRIQHLTLSPSAEEVVSQFNLVENKVVNAMSKGIEAEKIEQFIEIANKLKNNLTEFS